MHKLMHYKYFVISLSLSNLIFLPVWQENLNLSNEYYLRNGLPKIDVVATGANVLVLTIVSWVFASLSWRVGISIIEAAARLLFLAFFLIFLNHIRTNFTDLELVEAVDRVEGSAELAITLFVIACLMAILLRWHRTIASAAALVMAVFAPYTLITFSQAVWILSVDRSSSFQDKPSVERVSSDRSSPRVVWMIFDQMDERFAFQERPKDVQLQELDRFRSQAVVAGNAYAPSGWTIITMPALITGRIIDTAKPSSATQLMITFQQDGESAEWSEQRSVFDEARQRGINSAIVGIYHPYCRVLSNLASCFWQSQVEWLEPACRSLLCKMYEQVFKIIYNLPLMDRVSWIDQLKQKIERANAWPERKAGIIRYQNLLRSALDKVTDPELRLILIHWPIPHEPVIFDRVTNNFATDLRSVDSYDTLVLADHTLGLIRRAMEASGLWNKTTVIISADHGAKTFGVNGKREERRVPYMIKLSGQRKGKFVPNEISTIITHDLILSILFDELTSPQSVLDWLKQHAKFGRSPIFPGT